MDRYLEIGEMIHKGGAPVLYITLGWLVVNQMRTNSLIIRIAQRLRLVEKRVKLVDVSHLDVGPEEITNHG